MASLARYLRSAEAISAILFGHVVLSVSCDSVFSSAGLNSISPAGGGACGLTSDCAGTLVCTGG